MDGGAASAVLCGKCFGTPVRQPEGFKTADAESVGVKHIQSLPWMLTVPTNQIAPCRHAVKLHSELTQETFISQHSSVLWKIKTTINSVLMVRTSEHRQRITNFTLEKANQNWKYFAVQMMSEFLEYLKTLSETFRVRKVVHKVKPC